MPTPDQILTEMGGICLPDGTYSLGGIGAERGWTLPLYSTPDLSPWDVQSTYSEANSTPYTGTYSTAPGVTLFTDRWAERQRLLLQTLRGPFPSEQLDARLRIIARLETEGLNEGNVMEIGRELRPLGLRIPAIPVAAPVATTAPALMPLSPTAARQVVDTLAARGRTLADPAVSLPENIENYRFDGKTKIRNSAPLQGNAYSPLDRTIIVVDGSPGETFSVTRMDPARRDRFRSEMVQRAYAITNPRTDGMLRTDARSVEYHIIADAVDPATLQFLRESNPYLRVVRYDSAAAAAEGRGVVLVDSPRQFLRGDLEAEGTVSQAGDFVEVRRGDTLLRRIPRAQVTNHFYHYLDRLTPERAAEVRAVAAGRGWDLSTITRAEGAELLRELADQGRWTLPELHTLIGSEGMRSYYGYGSERPFGFETPEEFRTFRMDVLESLEGAGLRATSGGSRVLLSGSAMSGFSSKGGQFRWTETTDAFGNVREASDYDLKVIVSPEEFSRWVERSIAEAQPDGRRSLDAVRRNLRRYILDNDGIRWMELPQSFRDAMAPLLARNPNIQGITIAVEGGYWHVQDPMADALRMDLTEGLQPTDLVCEAPEARSAGTGTAGPAPAPPAANAEAAPPPAPGPELGREDLERFLRERYRVLDNSRYDGVVQDLADSFLRAEVGESGRISVVLLAERFDVFIDRITSRLEARSQAAVAEALRAEERERPRDRETLEREIRESMRRAAEIGARR